MLREALASFRRRPGYDDPTRVDHVALSSLGFKYLGTVLEQSPRHIWDVHHGDHIELRWEPRLHLKRCLQHRLVRDGHAPGVVRDDYFSIDLGY